MPNINEIAAKYGRPVQQNDAEGMTPQLLKSRADVLKSVFGMHQSAKTISPAHWNHAAKLLSDCLVLQKETSDAVKYAKAIHAEIEKKFKNKSVKF